MAKASRKQLFSPTKNLPVSGDYSDIDIICGEDTYHAHRSIVCPRSQFFAGIARFPGAESEERKVGLKDEEPAVVKLLMQYLYEGDYTPEIPDAFLSSQSLSANLTTSTAVHSNASLFSFSTNQPTTPRSNVSLFDPAPIPAPRSNPTPARSTQSIATTSFPHACPSEPSSRSPNFSPCTTRSCQHHTCAPGCGSGSSLFPSRCINFTYLQCLPDTISNAPTPPAWEKPADLHTHAKMYSIADRHIVTGLQDLARIKFSNACVHYWNSSEFPVAAEYVFASTPESDKGLRDLVRKIISKYMKLMNDPKIEELLLTYSELSYGLLKGTAKEHGWL